MDGACRATECAPRRYTPRRPSQSVLYRCVQQHLENWLAQCRDGYDDTGPCCRTWNGVRPLPRLRHPRPRFCPGPVRAVRTRLPDCLLLQGARRMPRVQRAENGGDRGASHRSRLAGPALRQWVLAVPKRRTDRVTPGRTRPRLAARGPARCRAEHLRPPSPAGTGVRVRSTYRLVTPIVDRPPRATLGRRMPAAAGHATRAVGFPILRTRAEQSPPLALGEGAEVSAERRH